MTGACNNDNIILLKLELFTIWALDPGQGDIHSARHVKRQLELTLGGCGGKSSHNAQNRSANRDLLGSQPGVATRPGNPPFEDASIYHAV